MASLEHSAFLSCGEVEGRVGKMYFAAILCFKFSKKKTELLHLVSQVLLLDSAWIPKDSLKESFSN